MKHIMLAFTLLVPITASAAAKNAGTSGGRFQLIQLSDMRMDQYLIDTETGRLWSRSCFYGANGPECKVPLWLEEKVENKNSSVQKVLQEIKGLKTAEEMQAGGAASK